MSHALSAVASPKQLQPPGRAQGRGGRPGEPAPFASLRYGTREAMGTPPNSMKSNSRTREFDRRARALTAKPNAHRMYSRRHHGAYGGGSIRTYSFAVKARRGAGCAVPAHPACPSH